MKLEGAVGLALAAGLATVTPPAPVRVTGPLVCSRGPSAQSFQTVVTMPSSLPAGAVLGVQIDGVPSGKISHMGLNYIHDMTTEYLVPAGTRYVEGSAHLVPGSGTPNVRAGARAWGARGVIHLVLPAHVENGSSYIPPSLAFDAQITAPAGAVVSLKFDRYEVTANVFLLGDLHTVCGPHPRPYTIGVTRVAPRSSL
jgi:hypothetical protein